MAPRLGDVAGNVALHHQWIGRASAAGCQLLVFPEMSLCGYLVRDLAPDVAISRRDPLLLELSQSAGGMDLVVGFAEEDARHGFYISAAYMHAGTVLHVHRKVYLPTYGLFEDMRYFGAGNQIAAFDTPFDSHPARTGVLICEDLWHPSTASVMSADGADLLVAVASSPGRGVRPGDGTSSSAESWSLLTRVYARFFTMFVLFCNRVGFEDGVNFFGGSHIVGPDGAVLAQGPELDEALVTAELDLGALRRERLKAPLLRDERLDVTVRELQRIQRQRTLEVG